MLLPISSSPNPVDPGTQTRRIPLIFHVDFHRWKQTEELGGGGAGGGHGWVDFPTLSVILFYQCCDKRRQGRSNGAKGASLASWGGTGEILPSYGHRERSSKPPSSLPRTQRPGHPTLSAPFSTDILYHTISSGTSLLKNNIYIFFLSWAKDAFPYWLMYQRRNHQS